MAADIVGEVEDHGLVYEEMLDVFDVFVDEIRLLEIASLFFDDDADDSHEGCLYFDFAGVPYCLRLDYPIDAKDGLARFQLSSRPWPVTEYQIVRSMVVERGGLVEAAAGTEKTVLKRSGHLVFSYLLTGKQL